ncbi:MAG: reverse transcriptase/maturase family protein [Parcubacteria group bacterium]
MHRDLMIKAYIHGPYSAFNISDPKPRNIHKASVRDRLLHHAIYRVLYPHFDKKFIHDSYSCRLNKGTHKAISKFKVYSLKVSKNNTKQCFILKCDIKKFFASIDHSILVQIIEKNIDDETMWLLKMVINSFHTDIGKGLPLGNLTSQLLVNIYMNEFDQFVKHKLKAKWYIRYADDFVLMSEDRKELEDNVRYIECYLNDILKLSFHPYKVFIKTLSSGVDFLGWVHFDDHRVLRTATKKKMLRNLKNNKSAGPLNSYLGLLKHGNAHKLEEIIKML